MGIAVRAVLAATAAVLVLPGPAHGAPAAPGTAARPALSAQEAAAFTEDRYLRWSGTYAAPTADPWRPRAITLPHRPDFVVGPALRGGVTHTTVQDAVDAVFALGGTTRRGIQVLPGTYTGTVFIPPGTPPLTLFGAGRPEDVRLEYTLDATATPAAWAALVNPSGQYVDGDPAWEMFQSCATKTTATVGLCATAPWAPAATTARPFAARVDPGRDLDDVHYNRLWEYGDAGL